MIVLVLIAELQLTRIWSWVSGCWRGPFLGVFGQNLVCCYCCLFFFLFQIGSGCSIYDFFRFLLVFFVIFKVFFVIFLYILLFCW